MVYASIREKVFIRLKAAFEKKYDAVSLEYYCSEEGAGKILTKLYKEMQVGNKLGADVLWLTDPFSFKRLKDNDVLAPFFSKEEALVHDRYKDKDHCFIGACKINLGICYNPSKIAPSELPLDFKELTSPSFEGQIILSDPSISMPTKYFVASCLSNNKLRFSFLRKLKDNGCEVGSGDFSSLRQISLGNFSLGIGVDYIAKSLNKEGESIAFLDNRKTLLTMYSPIALVKDSADPETASLFIDFVLSEEGQKILAENNIVSIKEGEKKRNYLYKDENIHSFEDQNFIDIYHNSVTRFDRIFKNED